MSSASFVPSSFESADNTTTDADGTERAPPPDYNDSLSTQRKAVLWSALSFILAVVTVLVCRFRCLELMAILSLLTAARRTSTREEMAR